MLGEYYRVIIILCAHVMLSWLLGTHMPAIEFRVTQLGLQIGFYPRHCYYDNTACSTAEILCACGSTEIRLALELSHLVKCRAL